jgi:hypothetical protein
VKAKVPVTFEKLLNGGSLFFATHMMEQGAELGLTGELLGHSDPETTRRYSASATPAKREAVAKQSLLNQMVMEDADEEEKSGRAGN